MPRVTQSTPFVECWDSSVLGIALPFNHSVTVLLINYNSGTQLRDAIVSLERQKYQANEIIVIDNASHDGSLDGINWSASRNLKCIRLKRNLGFAEATNIGVRMARSKWIAMLNCDAVAAPDWLFNLKMAAARHPEQKIFASAQIKLDNANSLDGAGDVYSATGLAWRGGYSSEREQMPAEGFCFGACAAGAFIKRETFLNVGGYEKSFFCYMEDVDFAYRAQLKNEDCIFVPSAKVFHRGGGAGEKLTDWRQRISAKNRFSVFVRNTPLTITIFMFPAFIVGFLASVLHAARVGQAHAIVGGTMDGIRALPLSLKQRWQLKTPVFPPINLLKRISWNPWRLILRNPKVQPISAAPLGATVTRFGDPVTLVQLRHQSGWTPPWRAVTSFAASETTAPKYAKWSSLNRMDGPETEIPAQGSPLRL